VFRAVAPFRPVQGRKLRLEVRSRNGQADRESFRFSIASDLVGERACDGMRAADDAERALKL
jgi:hypothetical protein